MELLQFANAEYFVCNLGGFELSEALRYWKAKFETIKHFKRDVIKHIGLAELGVFVEECWNTIEPITIGEALKEKNMEKRRVMFDCIGISKLFAQLNPELLDRQEVQKIRMRWDENNKPYQYKFNDTYELYKIPGEKLFVFPAESWNKPVPVYAVRCWCTTTAREYWIYIPEEIALGAPSWKTKAHKPDAIRAIAWTIRLDLSYPEKIYRQGDIIVAVESENSQSVTPYHLNKELYLHLMYSET
ncbi:MAG: hypothetical protein BGO31_10930 [Bacteroidetes bacterium 43-16]|uniref:hypothetical protein n=1 Tax=uncultured Dysgonomonas sp. TaxID=206096 RepID=UPI00092B1F1B|nr:hypothetical protein [uncultured Dysgonomonas sp.]OJV50973.1 MAG: hypothetical protein BGO31_10930 [Bacteroidetes bacterium 43-16]